MSENHQLPDRIWLQSEKAGEPMNTQSKVIGAIEALEKLQKVHRLFSGFVSILIINEKLFSLKTMPKKPLPTIPPSLTIADLARWIDELGVSFATVDAVIGKAPGAFQKYLNLETKMKHEDFVTLQDWLRIRSEALRRE